MLSSSWTPLVAVLLYYAAALLLRSWIQYRRTGINPFTLFRDREDTLYKFVGRWMSILLVAVLVETVAWALKRPLAAKVFEPGFATAWGGFALIVASTAVTLLAQSTMADSWRIGIDNQHKTALITTGLFRYSRNPIFVSMLLALTGLFFLVPTYLTASALVLSVVVIGVQVRLEEAFLLEQHGDAYRTYLRKAPRYL